MAERRFSMASGFELRRLVEALGREFRRRDMEKHLRMLRELYRDVFLRRPHNPHALPLDLALEWLALMRLGPFKRIYPVFPRASDCPFCKARSARGSPSVWVESAWPGGSKIQCNTCGGVWLNLEEPPV